MKKTVFAICSTVLAAVTAYAQMPGVDSVNVPLMVSKQLEAVSKPMRFRLTMTDGKIERNEWELMTSIGNPAVISSVTAYPFAKDCGFDPAGKMVITTGQVDAGLVASATPIQESQGEASVKIDLNYVYLKNMARQEAQGGCTVDLPQTDEQNVNGYVVRLRIGQKMKLPSDARDQYRFTIQRI
ncbi:hypothetical protein JAB4_059240 (plasmid) [Janthinobacterium sp. HH102]|uniref:hypothetical protein n=1 Tax=Janthinobacterium sp. HH102 TaxID=1537274 RepID=UPI0008747E69|nr:hypothetical protein [Janthinobacterium sp. HH102]QOU76424.1 hypothetical protein JAB4_059240 [Janthinobacterium sp. HH102]